MKRINRAKPWIPEADIEPILSLIRQSLSSGQLTNGPVVKEFENAFAASAGVRHAIAVSTGTAALEISLRAIDVRDKEVILPSETFVASANSIIVSGGIPVFAEIHPDTYCLDVEDVERKITSRTAAVMLVHMAGLIVPDIRGFQQLCETRKLALIEDAAHAHGASFDGQGAGSFGRAGCFSFYPTKVITSAEGGMITTNDDELAKSARSLRNHGANPEGADYVAVSTNMRMADPLAAIGLVQMRRLQEFVARRNVIAQIYQSGLRDLAGIRLLPPASGVHSYWNYLIVLEHPGIDRSALANRLIENYGIETAWPYDPPCHLQPVFRGHLCSESGDLPISESLLQRHLAIPMHGTLTDEEAHRVVAGIRNAVGEVLQA